MLLLQNEGLFNSCPKAWHDVWSGDKIRQECLDTVNTAGRGRDGWWLLHSPLKLPVQCFVIHSNRIIQHILWSDPHKNYDQTMMYGCHRFNACVSLKWCLLLQLLTLNIVLYSNSISLSKKLLLYLFVFIFTAWRYINWIFFLRCIKFGSIIQVTANKIS